MNASDTLTPAEVVRDSFAQAGLSLRKLAAELGLASSTVVRWLHPQPAGCGGTVPSRYHRTLLELAAQKGAKLTPTDLVLGRKAANEQ